MKPKRVINIGSTTTEVIITHARRSLLYFIRNFVDANLMYHQEEILRRIDKRDKDDKA